MVTHRRSARSREGPVKPPFSFIEYVADTEGPCAYDAIDLSYRAADDHHWASVRYRIPLAERRDPAFFIVKQWVNDWWPPPSPDMNLRDRGTVRLIPMCADVAAADIETGSETEPLSTSRPKQGPARSGPTPWVFGLDYHGDRGCTAHIHGTNIEVRIPDGIDPDDPNVPTVLARLRPATRGPSSWFARSYHPHRDVPDRGSGDGLLADLDWSPWIAAPEHPGCPPPELIAPNRAPSRWSIDATGARVNRRLDHAERQWVAVDDATGDPLMWARALPIRSRHRHPLLVRVDARYRLDWEETPIGWAGSLEAEHGHHVVLLERGDLRIEVWIGLHARLTRSQAAAVADKLFP